MWPRSQTSNSYIHIYLDMNVTPYSFSDLFSDMKTMPYHDRQTDRLCMDHMHFAKYLNYIILHECV